MHKINVQEIATRGPCHTRTAYQIIRPPSEVPTCRFAPEIKDRTGTDQNSYCNGDCAVVTPRHRDASATESRAAKAPERGPLQTLKQRSAERNAQARIAGPHASPGATTQPCSIAKGVCSAAVRKSQAEAEANALSGRAILYIIPVYYVLLCSQCNATCFRLAGKITSNTGYSVL